MNKLKFAVYVVVFLAVSLMIPHSSLWNIGTGKAEAAIASSLLTCLDSCDPTDDACIIGCYNDDKSSYLCQDMAAAKDPDLDFGLQCNENCEGMSILGGPSTLPECDINFKTKIAELSSSNPGNPGGGFTVNVTSTANLCDSNCKTSTVYDGGTCVEVGKEGSYDSSKMYIINGETRLCPENNYCYCKIASISSSSIPDADCNNFCAIRGDTGKCDDTPATAAGASSSSVNYCSSIAKVCNCYGSNTGVIAPVGKSYFCLNSEGKRECSQTYINNKCISAPLDTASCNSMVNLNPVNLDDSKCIAAGGHCNSFGSYNCGGVYKPGLCNGYAESIDCCIEADYNIATCQDCLASGKKWCQADDDPTNKNTGYCMDSSANCISSAYSRIPDSGPCPTGGDGSGVSTTNTACQNCINSGKFYCDTGFNILTAATGAAKSPCQNTEPLAQGVCAPYNGKVIPPKGTCTVESCSDRCQKSVLSGGLLTSNMNTASFPVGQCSEINPSSYQGYINTQGSNLLSSTSLGKGGCPNPNENCYCMRMSTAAISTSTTSNTNSAVISGTTPISWNDPAALQDYPRKDDNTLNCESVNDATVSLNINPTLAQTNEPITISGDVGLLTNSCLGYERTCRAYTTAIQYSKSSGFFKDTYKIQPCSSGYPNVVYKVCRGSVGEPECSDWHMTKIIIIAVIVAAVVGCSISSMGSGAGVCAKIAAKLGLGKIEGSNVIWSKITAKQIITFATAAAAAAITIKSATNQLSGNTGQTVYTTPTTPENPSYSICAKEYKTSVGANPVCSQGGNVIGFKEGTYTCQQGSCAAISGKNVRIEVYYQNNAIINTSTPTDASGKYSYTMNAPSTEGKYSVRVTVPDLKPAVISTTGNAVVRPLLGYEHIYEGPDAVEPLEVVRK